MLAHSAMIGNVGFGEAGVTVPETGTYRSADKTEARHYNAGDKVNLETARRFQIPGAEIVGSGPAVDDAQLADALRIVVAAGYQVGRGDGDGPANVDARVVREGGVPPVIAPDLGEQPKWYQALAAKAAEQGETIAVREEGETEKAFVERTSGAKAEPEPENKSEPPFENKSE